MAEFVLVGAAGYGNYYLSLLKEFLDQKRHRFTAIIDPYFQKEKSEDTFIKEIPIYTTLEDFYSVHQKTDLVILVSPVHCHFAQIKTALAHGSHVLCEKPLVSTIQDALYLLELEQHCSLKVGVGFQLSWMKSILDLKRDILLGLYGSPVLLKAHVSWKRGNDYYDKHGWKGKLRAPNGDWLLDSIATNAASHYLHNIFFLTGKTLFESNLPIEVKGSIYKGRNIETFDTIFLKGSLKGGGKFYFTATHLGELNSEPKFEFQFEKATIYFDAGTDGEITAVMNNGTRKYYGRAMGREEDMQKIISMLEVAEGKAEPSRAELWDCLCLTAFKGM